MSIYRKNPGSTDIPMDDGTCVAVLGPLPETLYDRDETGPMFNVAAVDGPYAGRHFHLFEDEIEREVSATA